MSGRGEVLIIGHRGASADHPENTIEAFTGAREQGADGVELDVRLTADGALIVHHDPIYRDGRTVWDTPCDERPAGVPVLEAALDACAGMFVNVEIKNSPGDLGGDHVPHTTEVADRVLGLLASRAAAGPADDVLVSCFDLVTLDRVRALDAELRTGFLVLDPGAAIDVGSTTTDAVTVAAERGHDALHPWDPFVDDALVERCASLGLRLNTWTVDDEDRIRALAALGVDGVVTNVPGRARQALGRA
jgi:glycerophosphoryl diester phosphodiesterase